MKKFILVSCVISIVVSCGKHENEEVNTDPVPVITNDTIDKTVSSDTIISPDTLPRLHPEGGEIGQLYLIQYIDSLGNNLLDTTFVGAYNQSKIKIYKDSDFKEEFNKFIINDLYDCWRLCVLRPYYEEECDSVVVSDANYLYLTVYIKLSDTDCDTLQMVERESFHGEVSTPCEKCFYNTDTIMDNYLTVIK